MQKKISKKKSSNKRSNNRGAIVIILALIIAVIFSLVVVASMRIVIQDKKRTSSSVTSAISYQKAEEAVECVIWAMKTINQSCDTTDPIKQSAARNELKNGGTDASNYTLDAIQNHLCGDTRYTNSSGDFIVKFYHKDRSNPAPSSQTTTQITNLNASPSYVDILVAEGMDSNSKKMRKIEVELHVPNPTSPDLGCCTLLSTDLAGNSYLDFWQFNENSKFDANSQAGYKGFCAP